MVKQLVLMAGGKGSRLGLISKKIPKCLIKVNGKELIRYHIEFAKKNNIKKILILTGYKHFMVKQFIGKFKINNLKIKLLKDKVYRGTGLSLIKNIKYFDNNFLLVYADLFHSLNLKKFIEFHKIKKSDLSMVINKNDHPEDSNLIEIDNNKKIKKFYLYPHKNLPSKTLFSNEAIFLIKKCLIGSVKVNDFLKKVDFVKDILPKYLKKMKMFGFFEKKKIVDCGKISRIKQLENMLKKSTK